MNERKVRVFSLLGWSVLVFILWFLWMRGAVMQDAPLTEAGRGMVIMITGGCCGSVWLAGLLALALIFALIRR